jgi:thiol-disulfide isomerase/thioredoxin
MIDKLVEFGKPALVAVVIVLSLQASGWWGSVSSVGQSALMKTGMLDALSSDLSREAPNFDFNFTIKDLEGNKLSFTRFKGKVIFLNLWATWCGPCRAEMPTIQALYDDIQKDSIVFVMLSLDKDSAKEKIVKYIKNSAYTFPVYQPSGYLTQQLGVPSIPTTFVVSKEGKIVANEVGTTNFNTAKFKRFMMDQASK